MYKRLIVVRHLNDIDVKDILVENTNVLYHSMVYSAQINKEIKKAKDELGGFIDEDYTISEIVSEDISIGFGAYVDDMLIRYYDSLVSTKIHKYKTKLMKAHGKDDVAVRRSKENVTLRLSSCNIEHKPTEIEIKSTGYVTVYSLTTDTSLPNLVQVKVQI